MRWEEERSEVDEMRTGEALGSIVRPSVWNRG